MSSKISKNKQIFKVLEKLKTFQKFWTWSQETVKNISTENEQVFKNQTKPPKLNW